MDEDFHFADAGSVENKIPEDKEFKQNIKRLIFGIIILLILIGLVILIFIISSSNSKDDYIHPKSDIIGEIQCIYDIESISLTQILGNDFIKNSNFDIEINGQKIKYSKEYKFSETGQQKVIFLLYDNLNMENMFKGVSSLYSVKMHSDKNAKIDFIDSAFENCLKLTNFKIIGFNLADLKSMKKLFYKSGLNSFDSDYLRTQNLLDISYMFAETNLEKIKMSLLDTSAVYNMSHLFEKCASLNDIYILELKTDKVKDMSYMFSGCEILESIDLSSLNTSNLENMSNMFKDCILLTSIDLSNLDTKNIVDMSYLFDSCSSLKKINLDNLDTSKVQNMAFMFSQLTNLESLDLSNFNTKNVKSMKSMFLFNRNLKELNLTNLNTQNVEDMSYMFENCISLQSIDVSSFDTRNVINIKGMFKDCQSITNLNLKNFVT